MGDVASVGLYTLNGCTYVMIKQTNNPNGGELHLGMETFSSLMLLLKGLESEPLKIRFRSILILIMVLYRVIPTLYSVPCSSPRPAPYNMLLVVNLVWTWPTIQRLLSARTLQKRLGRKEAKLGSERNLVKSKKILYLFEIYLY